MSEAGKIAAGPPGPGRRILYIDDDPGTSRLAERHLRRQGFDVDCAPSGPAGLALLGQNRYDAVALDHYMPGQDGLETLAALRQFAEPPPVIYVTGTDEGRVAVAAIKAGAADYVIKDVAGEFLTLLHSAIESALANVELKRQKEAAEHALVVAKEKAEAAARARSRLLASTGHDLKQPVNVISMVLDLIEPDLPAATEKFFGRARAAIDTLARALDSLLEAARLESGTLEPRLEAIPLGGLLREIVEMSSAQAEGKGLVLRAVPSSLSIVSDRDMLVTILSNLVGNAVKYTDAGRIVVGARRRGGTAEIQIADTGIGIPESELDRIFEEFHRAHGRGRTGMGLGLSIVKRAADFLGHDVTVRSVPGRGSVFSITVPLSPDSDGKAPPVASDA